MVEVDHRARWGFLRVTMAKEAAQSREPDVLANQYPLVRRQTEALCAPLERDDYLLQSMPDASPVKWHLAHTTWFFETFLLFAHLPGYRPFRPEFRTLFNSYYQGVGPRWPRHERGLIARPTVADVYQYRTYVNEQLDQLFQTLSGDSFATIASVVELGINHEQQHQELIVTDLKHAWAVNPIHPIYRELAPERGNPPPNEWLSFPEKVV